MEQSLFIAVAAIGTPILVLVTLVAIVIVTILVSYTQTYLDNRRTKKLVVQDARRMRTAKRALTYPQSYPEGWYRLLDASDLTRGQLREVDALGELFTVFRGEDGKVGVLDSYCPHLGANFSHGGKVVDNCVQCPFHLWKFDAAGTCKEIPSIKCEQVPQSLRAKSWPCVEKYGMIFVFYSWTHATGASADTNATSGPISPPYEISDKIVLSDWRHVGSYSREVDMHLQEFAENSVDFQHFQPLHGRMRLPFTNIPIPGVNIIHKAHWEPRKDEDEKHIAYFYDEAYLEVFGKHLDKTTKLNATITFYGPGGLVYFTFHTPAGPIVLFQTHTPTSLTHLSVRFHYFAPPSVPSWLVWYVCGNWISQWFQDLMIWENKIYRPKPFLIKTDGPVIRLRQWYAQFYPPKGSQNLDW